MPKTETNDKIKSIAIDIASDAYVSLGYINDLKDRLRNSFFVNDPEINTILYELNIILSSIKLDAGVITLYTSK